MYSVDVQITRLTIDAYPGWVECVLQDTSGREWVFEEKIPVIGADHVDADSPFPQPGDIACEMIREWTDEEGRGRCVIDTARPWGVETKEGESQFEVFRDQVRIHYPETHKFSTFEIKAESPTELKFQQMRDCRYVAVINLALPPSDPVIEQEDRIVASLGLTYIHIPVDFKAPISRNFQTFCAVMKAFEGRRVFVHCVANLRTSVFIFLYRVLHQQIPRSQAERHLHAIWQPDAVWSCFIENQLAGH